MTGEPNWEDVGFEPTIVTGTDESRAVDHFLDLIAEQDGQGLRHLGDVNLDSAVKYAQMRPLGGSRVWDYRSELDISPLQAVTLACWGLETASQYGSPSVFFV